MIDPIIKHMQEHYTEKNIAHFRELAAAERLRRDILGALLVVFGVPLLFALPFAIAALFGQ